MKNLVLVLEKLNFNYLLFAKNLLKEKFDLLLNKNKFENIAIFVDENIFENDLNKNLFDNFDKLKEFVYNEIIKFNNWFVYKDIFDFFYIQKKNFENFEDKENIYFLLLEFDSIFFDIDLNSKIIEESIKYDIQYYYGEGFSDGIIGQVYKYEIIEDIIPLLNKNDEIRKNFIFDILLRNITNFDIDLIEGNENFEAFRTSLRIRNEEDIPVILKLFVLYFLIKDSEILKALSDENFIFNFIKFEDYKDYYENIFLREKLFNSNEFNQKFDKEEILNILEFLISFYEYDKDILSNIEKTIIFLKERKIINNEFSFKNDIILYSPYNFIDNIFKIFPEIVFSFPKTIILEISSTCSFSCISCPYTYGLKREKKYLMLDEIKIIYEKNSNIFKNAIFIIGGFGEPFENENAFDIINFLSKNNKVYVETNCSKFTSDITKKLENLKNVFFIFNVDAFSEATYSKLGKKLNFSKLETFCKYYLEKYPDSFYIQFIRMKENDEELEAFYEKWKKFENNIIFRKYNTFSNYLEDRDVVDLTPTIRYPCFHLRRDLLILSDGKIGLCKSDFNGEILNYNLFENDLIIYPVLNKLFSFYKDHCRKNYPSICKNCNEFYTFYF